MMRSLTILNDRGDVTIVWEEDSDDKMEAIIEEKMKQGVIFFIIEPRLGGLAAPKKTKLGDAADAKNYRALAIRDEQFASFVSSGAGEAIKTPETKAVTVRKAKTAKEVATSETVAVKQMQGG